MPFVTAEVLASKLFVINSSDTRVSQDLNEGHQPQPYPLSSWLARLHKHVNAIADSATFTFTLFTVLSPTFLPSSRPCNVDNVSFARPSTLDRSTIDLCHTRCLPHHWKKQPLDTIGVIRLLGQRSTVHVIVHGVAYSPATVREKGLSSAAVL